MPTFRRRLYYNLKIERKRKRRLYKMLCLCVCLCVYHFLVPTRPAWNAHRILLVEFVGRKALGSKGGEKKTILQRILRKYVFKMNGGWNHFGAVSDRAIIWWPRCSLGISSFFWQTLCSNWIVSLLTAAVGLIIIYLPLGADSFLRS